MQHVILVLFVALAPIAFLFTYVYLRDKYEPEPLEFLIKSFLLGGFICLPIALFQLALGADAVGGNQKLGIALYFIQTVLIIAGSEELGKFLILRLYMYRKSDFNEPYDGIMYAVAISLGFAALENLIYVCTYGISVGYLRMITAVPAHASFGVLMGFYVGRAKFCHRPNQTGPDLLRGVGAAVAAHGLYDFCILSKQLLALPLGFLVLAVCSHLSLKAIQMHQDLSAQKFGVQSATSGKDLSITTHKSRYL